MDITITSILEFLTLYYCIGTSSLNTLHTLIHINRVKCQCFFFRFCVSNGQGKLIISRNGDISNYVRVNELCKVKVTTETDEVV